MATVIRSREATESIQKTEASNSAPPAVSPKPIWPDYFARLGHEDSTTWQYKGYWEDTVTAWTAYYSFLIRHPIKAFAGCRQFFQTLIYRVFGQAVGDRSPLPIALVTPLLLLLSPLLSLLAVAVAKIPYLRKLTPPLFQPFSYMGWTNYCVMLILVFTWHGYRQRKAKIHPMLPFQHSSKLFWNDFFTDNLPAGHHATTILSRFKNGQFSAPMPKENIILKPESGGAGYKLRSMAWDEPNGVYRCTDIELKTSEPRVLTPHELELYIRSQQMNFLIERHISPRPPLPVSSLRVMTLNVTGKAELICSVFLPAPAGSISTAYFDLDIYMLDYADNCIGQPIRYHSDGKFSGIPIPELGSVTETCLNLHDRLPAHLEISWDIILTADGPTYLEGNVFPPGCDYKLSIFKKQENISYIRNRILNGI